MHMIAGEKKISEDMNLNLPQKDNIKVLQHVKNLAFSRTTSTVGEIRGVNYIREELEKEGINSKTDFFSFSGPKRFLMRFFYILIFVNLILYKLILIIVLYFSVKYLFPRLRKFSLVEKENSKNVLARFESEPQDEKRPLIIFSAHHDSFSAIIPNKLQKVLYFVFRVFIIPFLFITTIIAATIILLQFYSINLFSFGIFNGFNEVDLVLSFTLFEFVLVVLVVLLVYNDEKSTGSVDNASGVAVLIELAKVIKRSPPKNIDIQFLWTGAEEWGLKGARGYVNKYKDQLIEKYDLDRSYVINIDMVGSYIGLLEKKSTFSKKRWTKINPIIQKSAQDLSIPIETFNKKVGPITDHKIFQDLAKKTKSDLQVACIHADKDSKYIHSPQDKPDNCSEEVLRDCVTLCYDVVRKIDDMNGDN